MKIVDLWLRSGWPSPYTLLWVCFVWSVVSYITELAALSANNYTKWFNGH